MPDRLLALSVASQSSPLTLSYFPNLSRDIALPTDRSGYILVKQRELDETIKACRIGIVVGL